MSPSTCLPLNLLSRPTFCLGSSVKSDCWSLGTDPAPYGVQDSGSPLMAPACHCPYLQSTLHTWACQTPLQGHVLCSEHPEASSHPGPPRAHQATGFPRSDLASHPQALAPQAQPHRPLHSSLHGPEHSQGSTPCLPSMTTDPMWLSSNSAPPHSHPHAPSSLSLLLP